MRCCADPAATIERERARNLLSGISQAALCGEGSFHRVSHAHAQSVGCICKAAVVEWTTHQNRGKYRCWKYLLKSCFNCPPSPGKYVFYFDASVLIGFSNFINQDSFKRKPRALAAQRTSHSLVSRYLAMRSYVILKHCVQTTNGQ